MPHYQRNIRFVLFLVLPILGFLLGWSLSQKNASVARDVSVELPVEEKSEEDIHTNVIKSSSKFFRKTDPKDVDLDIFWEVWHLTESNFLHPERFKTQEQVYGATRGLVDSLEDPYTIFLTPNETEEFDESMSGEFQGIGAEIDKRDGQIIVVSPLKGSPAESAGLKTGDIIFEVNGDPTHGWSITEAITNIRGPKGEKVVLTVIREDERKPVEITIVRDSIVLPTLEWEIKDDVAVISVYQFGNNVVKDFKKAVEEIVLEAPEGVVIDLRGNGGGLLDASIKIISEFLENEVVVKTSGRRFGDSGDLMSGRDGVFLDMPLVVIVNRGSASASEIFAGAMQDYRRGVVVGEKTFGKGSVQNLVPLSDGSSLKVTVAEWLTPKGRSIQDNGITPDVIVEPSDEPEIDLILDKALSLFGSDEMNEILSQPAPPIEAEESDVSQKLDSAPQVDNSENQLDESDEIAE